MEIQAPFLKTQAPSFLLLNPVASKTIPNNARTIPGTMLSQRIVCVPSEIVNAGAK